MAQALLYPVVVRLFFAVPAMAFLFFSFSVRYWDRYLDPTLRITFFDVGQGDGALVQFPYGKTLLIDAGGGYGNRDVGSNAIYPELGHLGILELNAVLLSHPDWDHGFGLHGIFRNVEVKELWINHDHEIDANPLMRSLMSLATVTETSVKPISEKKMFFWNGVEGTLYPLHGKAKETNNRSLVLRLEYGGSSVLFTGDIEKAGEIALMREKPGPVTILKVPHHGSKTSSTKGLLRVLKPRWAVVSAGRDNRYGHPNAGVLERYRGAGTAVLRTDFHGYVKFTISKEGKISCENFLGTCGAD